MPAVASCPMCIGSMVPGSVGYTCPEVMMFGRESVGGEISWNGTVGRMRLGVDLACRVGLREA